MSAGDKLALAMIPEIDIWRAASLMLKRYGEKALVGAHRLGPFGSCDERTVERFRNECLRPADGREGQRDLSASVAVSTLSYR